jgi:hypothetical protein
MIYGDRGIFFLSAGRAGTETIHTILKSFDGISSYHEPHPLLFELGSKAYGGPEIDRDFILSEIESKRKNIWSTLKINTYIETSPQVTFVHEYFQYFFDACKYVWMIREPIEFINSGLNREYYKTDLHWDKNRIKPKKDTNYNAIWNGLNQSSKILWLWTETNKYIYDKISNLPKNTFFTIYSKDIFNNTTKLYELLKFCNKDAACDTNQVLNILNKKLNKNIRAQYKYKSLSELDINDYILNDFYTHYDLFKKYFN